MRRTPESSVGSSRRRQDDRFDRSYIHDILTGAKWIPPSHEFYHPLRSSRFFPFRQRSQNACGSPQNCKLPTRPTARITCDGHSGSAVALPTHGGCRPPTGVCGGSTTHRLPTPSRSASHLPVLKRGSWPGGIQLPFPQDRAPHIVGRSKLGPHRPLRESLVGRHGTAPCHAPLLRYSAYTSLPYPHPEAFFPVLHCWNIGRYDCQVSILWGYYWKKGNRTSRDEFPDFIRIPKGFSECKGLERGDRGRGNGNRLFGFPFSLGVLSLMRTCLFAILLQ